MPHLDMIRGLAALEVCLGHLRGFFLVDYAQSGGGAFNVILYTLTGLHHQAVVVFFVLSGFLVGGSVIRAHQRGSWSWGGYLTRRLARLWIVIVPALLLTVFWDMIGARLYPSGYAGVLLPQLLSGPDENYDLSARSFVGNLLFLQTIAVPPFGSNGPLWSLANEFWYYLIFPLALQAVLMTGAWTRAVAVVLLVAIAVLLPPIILGYGLIWLFGVAAFLVLESPRFGAVAGRWWVGVAALALLGVTLLASRLGLWLGNDFAIGLAFAASVPWLARARGASPLYRRIGFTMSEMSYTLYLVHFPLLTCLYFVFGAPAQFVPTGAALAVLAGVLAIILLYAGGVWWMFERNTDRVRGWIVRSVEQQGWRRSA